MDVWKIAILLTLAAAVIACGGNNTVTVYEIERVNPDAHFGHQWQTMNPSTFRVGETTVIEKSGSVLTKYKDCKATSVEDWECRFNDGSGRFGFRNGKFWRMPEWHGVKVVSKWRYNEVNCEWWWRDKQVSTVRAAYRCVSGIF